MGPWQRKCNMEKSGSESLQRNEKSTGQTVSHGGIHEPESCGNHSIRDLRRQLTRIEKPMFTGDKMSYQNWKAVFMARVDTVPASGEYKLLQIRQCLPALNVIENLGYSAAAYEAAKERLERRYGGKRRQVAISRKPRQFPTKKTGKGTRLGTVCRSVGNRHYQSEGKHHHSFKLGNGFLYGKLRTKVTESM